MRRLIACLVLGLVAAPAADALEPRKLAALIAQSDLIAVVEITKCERKIRKPGWKSRNEAAWTMHQHNAIVVERVLQRAPHVTVKDAILHSLWSNPGGMRCWGPRAVSYTPGRWVVFLEQLSPTEWITSYLSHGAARIRKGGRLESPHHNELRLTLKELEARIVKARQKEGKQVAWTANVLGGPQGDDRLRWRTWGTHQQLRTRGKAPLPFQKEYLAAYLPSKRMGKARFTKLVSKHAKLGFTGVWRGGSLYITSIKQPGETGAWLLRPPQRSQAQETHSTGN